MSVACLCALPVEHTLTLKQFSTIITLRIIFECATRIITIMGTYYSAQPCDKLNDIAASIAANGTEMLLAEFPACSAFLDGDLNAHAIVNVNFNGTAAQKMAAINMTFGMAGWVALAIHAFGVEVYVRPAHMTLLRISLIILQLHLTPEESKRLRQVSYERQLKAGHKHPGDSGLVSQPFRNIQEQGTSSPLGENIQPGSGDFSSGSGDSSADEKMLA